MVTKYSMYSGAFVGFVKEKSRLISWNFFFFENSKIILEYCHELCMLPLFDLLM